MSRVRGPICAALAVAAVFAVACRPGETRTICPLSLALPGIGVSVSPPLATHADTLDVQVCRQGTCVAKTTSIHPATIEGGTRPAFAEVTDLKAEPVHVTLTFRNGRGDVLATTAADVAPTESYPNGEHCGTTVFARIVVGGNGAVTGVNGGRRAE